MTAITTGREPLTGRQRAVLDAIRDYVTARGYPPTLREIGNTTGLGLSAVHHQLKNLAAKGYIRRDFGVPRGIVIEDGAR